MRLPRLSNGAYGFPLPSLEFPVPFRGTARTAGLAGLQHRRIIEEGAVESFPAFPRRESASRKYSQRNSSTHPSAEGTKPGGTKSQSRDPDDGSAETKGRIPTQHGAVVRTQQQAHQPEHTQTRRQKPLRGFAVYSMLNFLQTSNCISSRCPHAGLSGVSQYGNCGLPGEPSGRTFLSGLGEDGSL